MTVGNSVLTLQFCVNYGGRAEIADAAAAIAADVAAGKLRADKIDEKVFARYLDEPGIPDVDLFVRSLRRAAHLQLPDLAVGLRRVRLSRHAVPRLRPAPPVAGLRDLREPGSPLRRRRAESGCLGSGTAPVNARDADRLAVRRARGLPRRAQPCRPRTTATTSTQPMTTTRSRRPWATGRGQEMAASQAEHGGEAEQHGAAGPAAERQPGDQQATAEDREQPAR